MGAYGRLSVKLESFDAKLKEIRESQDYDTGKWASRETRLMTVTAKLDMSHSSFVVKLRDNDTDEHWCEYGGI